MVRFFWIRKNKQKQAKFPTIQDIQMLHKKHLLNHTQESKDKGLLKLQKASKVKCTNSTSFSLSKPTYTQIRL